MRKKPTIPTAAKAQGEPHDFCQMLKTSYADMAADETREADALEWSESLIGDVADEED